MMWESCVRCEAGFPNEDNSSFFPGVCRMPGPLLRASSSSPHILPGKGIPRVPGARGPVKLVKTHKACVTSRLGRIREGVFRRPELWRHQPCWAGGAMGDRDTACLCLRTPESSFLNQPQQTHNRTATFSSCLKLPNCPVSSA